MPTLGSENRFPLVRLVEDDPPSAAPAGQVHLFADTDKLLYQIDDAGTITALGSSLALPAGTDPGDIIAWDGSAYDVLPIGADGEVLSADSGETLGVKWAAAGAFDPDDHMPWHVSIIPMVWTPDAVVGTWVNSGSSSQITNPFYAPGSTANSGTAVEVSNSTNAQNDAIAYDVALSAGTWDAHFWVRANTAGPIITLNQDGASQGTVDTYAAANAASKVSVTGWTVATTGKHRMQLLCATKHASSSGYSLRITAIEFRRTA